MIFKEVELTDKILSELIACSEAWEQENSCHGYRKNTEEDIKGNRIFLALEDADNPCSVEGLFCAFSRSRLK